MVPGGANIPQQDGLVVCGEGKASAAPDRVILSIYVEGCGASATQALAEADRRTAQVAQVLTELGIDQADLQIAWRGVQRIQPPTAYPSQAGTIPPLDAVPTHASIGSPQSSYFSTGHAPSGNGQSGHPAMHAQPPLAYAAGSWLRVTLREPGRMGDVLDATSSAGATCCAGTTAGIQDEDALRHAALRAAAQDAWAKANVLAQAAGCRLGRVLAVVEETGAAPAAPGAITHEARVQIAFAWDDRAT